MTIAAAFISAVRDLPERRFLHWIRDGVHVTWTYAEAADRIGDLVARIEAVARPGEHVVVHTAAMVPSILFDLACAVAGVVFTPIETAALPEVLELCRRIDARAVLTTSDRNGPYERPVIHEDGTSPITSKLSLDELAARAARITDKTPYMLQPTSGTTGGPKLAIRDHGTFMRAPRFLAQGLERTTPERVLMVPALTHGMGQYLLGIGVALAAEYCVTSRIDVHASLAEIRTLDPTYMAFTPRVVRSLFAQRTGNEPLFGPSARLMLSGGASPDKDLLAQIVAMGLDVIEGFGASEFSVVAVTRRGNWRHDILGHVVDDVKLRLTDEGELHAWTPALMHGYYGNAEATRAAFTEDGFYRTGDRVEISPEGELRYLGRLVDSFNLFDGSHVEPGPIEDALTRLAWVQQLVLLGDQRPYLVGLVVANADRETIIRDVTALNATLPLNARVRRLGIVKEPFPEDIYLVVGHGKTRRSRKAALARHAALVDALYSTDGAGGPDVVELRSRVIAQTVDERHADGG